MATMTEYHRSYGGIQWRVTPLGVEIEGEGVQRTPGEPVTMRRLIHEWGSKIQAVCLITSIPAELLLMTIATEGALSYRDGKLSYPPLRQEPGYVSDEGTPHRISFGPMHVLLSTYRSVMKTPKADRQDAMRLSHNLMAGALFMRSGLSTTGLDPILVAARYNAGSLVPADSRTSRYYNRWHLRSYGNHLDRAARWYGDACAVVRETEFQPSQWYKPTPIRPQAPGVNG